jgi:hemerythrin-like domain-containing protein
MSSTRRNFVTGSLVSSAALVVSACARTPNGEAQSASAATNGAKAPAAASAKKDQDKDDDDVGAVEDLMREHGVLRRALVVYRETALRLRSHGDVPPDALRKTAMLFLAFGEDYHEKKLEEAYIFPAVKRAGGPAAPLADVLTAQHQRGRELTQYIIAVTQAPKIGANAEALAGVLDSFARMYESHAAREDTIVFPAWKKTMSKKQLEEMGDKFEDIEKQTFGKDGFDDGVKQISEVEAALGLTDIALLTAPPAPKLV